MCYFFIKYDIASYYILRILWSKCQGPLSILSNRSSAFSFVFLSHPSRTTYLRQSCYVSTFHFQSYTIREKRAQSLLWHHIGSRRVSHVRDAKRDHYGSSLVSNERAVFYGRLQALAGCPSRWFSWSESKLDIPNLYLLILVIIWCRPIFIVGYQIKWSFGKFVIILTKINIKKWYLAFFKQNF